ncbi:hypothetical protein FB451DRAFT_1570906 [Mycena latifolia]|nr:hypothetical protein FB451DRAFT_1570906 [Mycena latifolia]
MVAFKFICLAATAPLLVPAAYVVDTGVVETGVTARDVVPALFVRTELERFEYNTSTTVEKRLSIDDCIKYVELANACFDLGNNIRAIGSSIASVVFGSSGAKDCSVHTGSIDGLQWRYYATGRNCDTTAQLKTIRGAIDAFLRDSVNGKCQEACLKMTHGGTWTGYLSVSPVGAPAPSDCGPDGYGSCVEHGDGSDLGRVTLRPRSGTMLRPALKFAKLVNGHIVPTTACIESVGMPHCRAFMQKRGQALFTLGMQAHEICWTDAPSPTPTNEFVTTITGQVEQLRIPESKSI